MTQPWTPLTDEERAALLSIAQKVPRPEFGLQDDLFAFALKIVGITNVDLLTFDDRGRVLLAWREDGFGEGWHVPGGIIRKDEGIERRIAETARKELGAPVRADRSPSAILQFRGQRGAFISLVFRCRLAGAPEEGVGEELDRGRPGQLGWFAEMPFRTFPAHLVYRELIAPLRGGCPEGGPLMRTVVFTPDAVWLPPADEGGPE